MIKVFEFVFTNGHLPYGLWPVWMRIFTKFRNDRDKLIDDQYGKVKWSPSPNGLLDQNIVIKNGSDCLRINCIWKDNSSLSHIKVYATSQEFADWIETMWAMSND